MKLSKARAILLFVGGFIRGLGISLVFLSFGFTADSDLKAVLAFLVIAIALVLTGWAICTLAGEEA